MALTAMQMSKVRVVTSLSNAERLVQETMSSICLGTKDLQELSQALTCIGSVMARVAPSNDSPQDRR